MRGAGKLVRGTGPVRAGVTVVHPRGQGDAEPVFGAWFTLDGNGEMTGTTWLEERGRMGEAIAITSTHSVGVVRDPIPQWRAGRPGAQPREAFPPRRAYEDASSSRTLEETLARGRAIRPERTVGWMSPVSARAFGGS